MPEQLGLEGRLSLFFGQRGGKLDLGRVGNLAKLDFKALAAEASYAILATKRKQRLNIGNVFARGCAHDTRRCVSNALPPTDGGRRRRVPVKGIFPLFREFVLIGGFGIKVGQDAQVAYRHIGRHLERS